MPALQLSVEIAVRALAREPGAMAALAPGTEVFVPFLPGQDAAASAGACARLAGAGMTPVPHLPVRALAGRDGLRDALARLAGAGAASVLLVAGDRRRPAGPFADTLAALDSGIVEASGLRRLHVAGHPTGHPLADDGALHSALAAKAAWARGTGIAVTVVTQFVFDAAPVIAWLGALADRGIDLPVRVGVPGPARLRTLLAFALQCGVAATAEAAFARPIALARLAGRWTADRVVADLAAHRDRTGDSRLQGIHVYSFGGAGRAVDWAGALAAAGSGCGGRDRSGPAAAPDGLPRTVAWRP